jgi:uncharacterized protein
MTTVREDPDRSRFEIVVDGEVAGFTAYRVVDDRLVFTHTEIEPEHEGEGLAKQLVRQALDRVREQGRKVVAQCPFVAHFIEQHPAYADLVDRELAARFPTGADG